MVKTKEQAIEVLQDISYRNNLLGVSHAAMHVLENYQDYDYAGSDQLFLAFCEELVDTITVSPDDAEKLLASLGDDNNDAN